jgi:hypothetical protein
VSGSSRVAPASSSSPRTAPSGAPVKVVYILGSSRSGSTLLTSLLGEIGGFFAAAELSLIWQGLEERTCGCGRRVLECPVWSPAIRAALEHVRSGTDEGVIRLQHNTVRTRHLPRVMRAPHNVDSSETPIELYGDVLKAMYAGVANSAKARVVVDSSKNASEAVLLTKLDGIDPYMIQIVRDPRAVAYSWLRVIGRGRRSARHRWAALTGLRWVHHNLVAEWVGRHYGRDRVAVIRYEDLVARPRDTLASVAEMVGEPSGDLDFLVDPTAPRSSRHMVGGNALRFGERVVRLREDKEWMHASKTLDVAGVTAVTLPLLRRYRYSPLLTTRNGRS